MYIRKEDAEIWESIDNKPEFLHAALESIDSLKNRPLGKSDQLVTEHDKSATAKETVKHSDAYCPIGHISPWQDGNCAVKTCKYKRI